MRRHAVLEGVNQAPIAVPAAQPFEQQSSSWATSLQDLDSRSSRLDDNAGGTGLSIVIPDPNHASGPGAQSAYQSPLTSIDSAHLHNLGVERSAVLPHHQDIARQASFPPASARVGVVNNSWEQTGSIDPRWVSPQGSTWNTPAATPRGGSPVGDEGELFEGQRSV
jgi:hypothetical protein